MPHEGTRASSKGCECSRSLVPDLDRAVCSCSLLSSGGADVPGRIADQSLVPAAFAFRPTRASRGSSCVFAEPAAVSNPASLDSASSLRPAPHTDCWEQTSPPHAQAGDLCPMCWPPRCAHTSSDEGDTGGMEEIVSQGHTVMTLALTLPPGSHRTLGKSTSPESPESPSSSSHLRKGRFSPASLQCRRQQG